MELKVQVDGVERVVCGITQQTTVQVGFEAHISRYMADNQLQGFAK